MSNSKEFIEMFVSDEACKKCFLRNACGITTHNCWLRRCIPPYEKLGGK